MHGVTVIAKRELRVYFNSPLAYVFMFIFALLACGAALLPQFELFGRPFGGLLDKEECSLVVFFAGIPFLLAFFAPAMAMKLWADERKKGTIELLFTYPLTTSEIVLGKFAAAWIMLAIAMAATFPMLLLIESIGVLSYSLAVSGFLGVLLIAGAFTAVSCTASALTNNSVISLILGVFACSALLGLNLLPFEGGLIESLCHNAGALEHFQDLTTGKVGIEAVVYFVSVMAGCLFLNVFFLEK